MLPPATVPPVSDECTLTLVHDADGNVMPLNCSSGGVNIEAWDYFRQGSVGSKPSTTSKTMVLGQAATADQVLRAMCADYSNVYGTAPLTISAESLAAAYYGWHFAGNRLSTFGPFDCPSH